MILGTHNLYDNSVIWKAKQNVWFICKTIQRLILMHAVGLSSKINSAFDKKRSFCKVHV
jgi:hypothetical protein